MGLITKTAKVKWHSSTKKYYESLGYIFTKMGDEFEVKVEDLTEGSHVKIECFCDNCGQKLECIYYNYKRRLRDGKTYCNHCGILIFGVEKTNKIKLKNSKSFYDWCIENSREDLLLRWDYELNKCSPNEVCYSSNKKYWFKCLDNPKHKSELKNLSNITTGQQKSSECKQCKSIGQYIINIFGEEFLWKVWSDKNEKSPFEINCFYNKKVWWNCPDNKHEPYERSCSNSIKYEFRCPKCVEELRNSVIEEKTKIYLEELGYEVKTEYNCSIKIINPKTNYPLPLDNEIELENEKHLIIEVHGKQHYKIDTYTRTEEELHQRKLYDRYKRIKCIQAGYEYLEIPYTAFNKEETYKKLINNKIKEILES